MSENETPALSPSIAQVLLTESPKHAWTIHRLLGNQPRPTTEAQEKGQLIHELILGGSRIAVIDAKDFRTKDAREQRDAAREAGKVPIVKSKADEFFSIAQEFKDKIEQRIGIAIDEWTTEVRMEWTEPVFGDYPDVICHGVLDLISPDHSRIVDLKLLTAGRATPERCARALYYSHGLLQAEAYKHAVEQGFPKLVGRVNVEYLFLEMTAPFDIRHAELSGSLQEIAVQRWQRAIELWARCLKTNRWPGFIDEGLTRLDAPAWLMARELEHVYEEDE